MKIVKKFNLESRNFYERYLMDEDDESWKDEAALDVSAHESYKHIIAGSDKNEKKVVCEKKKETFEKYARHAEMIACMQDLDFMAEIKDTIGTIRLAGDCLFFDDEITFFTHRKWFNELIIHADGLWFSVTKKNLLQIHLDYELAKIKE